MTKKINLTEIEDTEYKYYEPKPKDEKEFVAQHKPTRRDVPKENGKDVFAHFKSMKKDKTREADPAGFDKVNRGGNLGKEVRAMELPESSIDRIRRKAATVVEGTDDGASPPAPVASDNPQSGIAQVEPDPKPSSADPMGPIRSQLKNIAMAAADIYDGVSENTTMEPWMTQTISKAEGEFSKIIEQFRKKTSGPGPENQVAETYESKKWQQNERERKANAAPKRGGNKPAEATDPKAPINPGEVVPAKKITWTRTQEAYDPPNPKLEGDHEGNPVYVYPVTKNKIKVPKIVEYPLVSKNLTPVHEQEVIFEASTYKHLSKLHDALIKAGYTHLHTKHSNPEETEYSTGRSEYIKHNGNGQDHIVVHHAPGDCSHDPVLHRIIRTKTSGEKPEDFSLAESIHINEVLKMSDDQMSRYANYIALHEAKRKGLTESDRAMRDAKRAMGPAAKETEHEPEEDEGAKERDEEGNARGGHGAYVNDLRKVGNAGGMVKHGDGKMHEISRMEAKARYADIMSTPVAHGAREAKQKAHFNNPPKA